MSDAKNQLATQRELASQFRNPTGAKQAAPGGYTDEGGMPRNVAGDEEAPFLKTPPFLTPIAPWVLAQELIFGKDYTVLPEVECRAYRLISVYFAFRLTGTDGQLGIVPEARAEDRLGNIDWYPLGVVDSLVTPISVAPFGNGFASRTVSPSQVQTQALTGLAGRVVKFNLMWDVTGFDSFRLLVAELDEADEETGTLDVFYQLAL